jgi:CHAD domain-containing protein
VKARRVPGLDPSAPLAVNAALIVRTRLDELSELATDALEPENRRAQHDMRIAAKRLRYVLEVTGASFGSIADEGRARARDLQDVLGDLHDCDVLLPRIDEHVREAGDAGGLDRLADDTRARRRLLFERFRTLWDEQLHAGTWDDLRGAAAELV